MLRLDLAAVVDATTRLTPFHDDDIAVVTVREVAALAGSSGSALRLALATVVADPETACPAAAGDARRCKEILRIPDRYAIPMIVATGFEYDNGDETASDEAVTPRLALDEVVFSDSFGVPYGEGDSEEGGDILQST